MPTGQGLRLYRYEQYQSGTPVVFACEVPESNRLVIQLAPTQIRSLVKSGIYDPQINSVYTDQIAVNVGFQTCLHPAGDVQQ